MASPSLIQTLRNILGLKGHETHIVALSVGPPGSGKTLICKQLTYDYLTEGANVTYVCTERSPSQMLERMRGFGWDVESYVGRELKFVDLYSWQVDGDTRLGETQYGFRMCPLSQTDMLLTAGRVRERMKGEYHRTIVDSLTTLATLIGEKDVTRLVQTMNARIRDSGVGLTTLTNAVHSREFETHMQTAHDLIFNLRLDMGDKPQRFMQIAKYVEGEHPTGWIPFSITNKGIELHTEKTSS